jgi:hypothetical protein
MMSPSLQAPNLSHKVAAGNTATGIALGLAAAVLYVVSFFLPAVPMVLGYEAFVYSLAIGICVPMWAANPVFWVGLCRLCVGQYKSAATAAVVAVVLALSGWWLFKDLSVGYFAWVGSMVLLAVAGFWMGYDEQGPGQSRVDGEAARIAARFSVMNGDPPPFPVVGPDCRIGPVSKERPPRPAQRRRWMRRSSPGTHASFATRLLRRLRQLGDTDISPR